MFGAIDIAAGTSAAGDIGIAVAALGALYITAVLSTKAFPLVGAWVGKLFRAARGS